MMKLNRKGYMLVEIVLASVLAISIAYYLLNLTYKFKNTYEDTQQSYYYMTDKILITKNIMEDLENGSVSNVILPTNATDPLTFDIDLKNGSKEKRKLLISDKTIEYGKINETTNDFVTGDVSYYKKTLPTVLILMQMEVNATNNGMTVKIPIRSIYDNNNYTVKLFAKTSTTKPITPPVETPTEPVTECVPLNTKDPGVYVDYGGIVGVDYCLADSYAYISKNWRLAYVEGDIPYIISAGALDCLSIPPANEADDLIGYLPLAQDIIKSSCIVEYSYNGTCVIDDSGFNIDIETNTTWPMQTTDFQKITGSELTKENCMSDSSEACGSSNDLIQNGGNYWIFPLMYTNSIRAAAWITTNSSVNWTEVVLPAGVRSINKLDPDVCVNGGSGTIDDPYTIDIK